MPMPSKLDLKTKSLQSGGGDDGSILDNNLAEAWFL